MLSVWRVTRFDNYLVYFRELYEPIIPPNYYDRCMECCDSPERAISIVESLPNINRLSLTYLIRFLQVSYIYLLRLFLTYLIRFLQVSYKIPVLLEALLSPLAAWYIIIHLVNIKCGRKLFKLAARAILLKFISNKNDFLMVLVSLWFLEKHFQNT